MCSPPSPTRSRTRGHRTATAPMPVMTSRSGRCPWRTSRRRPSSVNLSVWVLSQAATSASTACPNSVLAPLRKTSVSGSENVPGWVSSKTLVSVTAYRSFGGEVEALNTPTIRRLTLSRRHQLSALALHDLGSAAAVGGGKDNLGAPHVLLWCAAIRNDRLKPEAICSRDVDDNSCSHHESLNCFGRFGNRPNESDH